MIFMGWEEKFIYHCDDCNRLVTLDVEFFNNKTLCKDCYEKEVNIFENKKQREEQKKKFTIIK
jgi:hypothetical protein